MRLIAAALPGIFMPAHGARILKTTLLVLTTVMLLGAAGDYSNRRAPGFSLADSHYQQHDTQDYRGRLLVLDIMSTTCPVCGRLADTLVQISARYGDEVGILSILTNPDNFQSGDRFALAHKVSWPLIYDSGQVLASYLKATPATPTIHFPHLFVIDANGWIQNDFEGTDEKELALENLESVIDKLAAK